MEKKILVGPHVDEPEVFVRQSLARSFWHCRPFLKSDFPRRAEVSCSFRSHKPIRDAAYVVTLSMTCLAASLPPQAAISF